MDFHLPDDLREPFAKAVFGGPLPALKGINRAVRDNGLKWPLTLVAVSQWKPARPARSNVRLLQLHDGLTYLLTNQRPAALARWLRARRLAHGAMETASNAFHFFHAIQRSILALRERELSELESATSADAASPRKARPGRPTWQTELDTQRLLVYQLLRHDAQWPATAMLWMRIVMARQSTHLNEVRRKIAQLLSAVGQNVDANSRLGYVFTSAMDRLYRTHRFRDMPGLLVQSLRELIVHLPGEGATPNPQPPVVEQALAFMRAQAHEPISLRDVADHVNVTAAHLARVFKETTGQTVTQFLQRQRIILAMEKLTRSDASVLETALACGFGSVEHFHRVFRRQTGRSPRQYRVDQAR